MQVFMCVRETIYQNPNCTGVTHSQKELNSKFAHRRVLNFFQVWLESMQVYKYASLKHSTLLVCMYAWIHYKNVDFEIRYPTLRGPYFCQILINFKNSWHFCNQNFVGFAKMTNIFILGALWALWKWPTFLL